MEFSHASCPVTSSTPREMSDIIDDALDAHDVSRILDDYKKELELKTHHHMGYPYNLAFDCRELKQFMDFSINNLGDPFIESNYGVHSRMFEVAVLDWFAKLWGISREEYWGYITSCGTEGNLQGIYIGRENLPNGVLYASEDSHYSVFKAARLYRMPAERVKSNADGSIDLSDLRDRLRHNVGKPAIINCNIGTTFKGGVDDLDGIIAALREEGYKDGIDYYIHCDGALVGIMISLLETEYITFRKPIGSVSVSGHKFIGSPTPCGVIITRLDYLKKLAQNVEYINSRDATIMGSRNGHAPIMMWYTLVRKGLSGIDADVHHCIQHAQYLKNKLEAGGVTDVLLNKWSNTVVFPLSFICETERERFVRKWQLACSGAYAHIVTMPNIDENKLDEFVTDYLLSTHSEAFEF